MVSHLEQYALQLPDADVIDGACAELAEEFLGAERAQVLDHERPQVQHVVTRHAVALLYYHLGIFNFFIIIS